MLNSLLNMDMLNGHALSQRDGSVFNPWHNWEATPPGYSTCMRAWRWLAPHPGATAAWTYYAAQKSWRNTGMLAGVASCGMSQKWGCRGRLALGFKPRHGSHARGDHTALLRKEGTTRLWWASEPCSLGSWNARCSSDAKLSLSSLEECWRDTAGRKGVKGLLLVGQEKVPRRFGLRTGDPGDTADGAGNRGRPAIRARITGKNQGLPEPWTSISFPEIWYPGLGKGGKERLCAFVGILRDFGISVKTLSHYS